MKPALSVEPPSALADPSDGACGCRQCLRDRKEGQQRGEVFVPADMTRMVLCAQCGNKRCPHATDHRLACTGSNLPGQPGSAYA